VYIEDLILRKGDPRMAEPFQELDPETIERTIGALRDWALRQEDRSRPVLRFLDGAALSAQDLLDDDPRRSGRPMNYLLAPPGVSRAWRHLLNLVAVSLKYGENLEEILGELSSGNGG
jgi:hypothetical protein